MCIRDRYDSAVFTALSAVWGYTTSRGFIEPYPIISAGRMLGFGLDTNCECIGCRGFTSPSPFMPAERGLVAG